MKTNRHSLVSPSFQGQYLAEIATEEHVYALENVFSSTLNCKNSLVSEQIFSILSHELTDVTLEFVDVKFTFKLHAGRSNTVIVFVFDSVSRNSGSISSVFSNRRLNVDEFLQSMMLFWVWKIGANPLMDLIRDSTLASSPYEDQSCSA